MKKPPFETTVNGEKFRCLSNDWFRANIHLFAIFTKCTSAGLSGRT